MMNRGMSIERDRDVLQVNAAGAHGRATAQRMVSHRVAKLPLTAANRRSAERAMVEAARVSGLLMKACGEEITGQCNVITSHHPKT